MRVHQFAAAIAVSVAMLAVPSAAAADGSASESKQLTRQTTAGFYEVGSGRMVSRTVSPAGFYDFGGGKTLGEPNVAYVVPYGQRDRMPASVRNLPVVRAIEKPEGQPNDFDLGVVVLFGPDASLGVPLREMPAGTAPNNRAVAHMSEEDAYRCERNYFCIYHLYWWAGYRLQWGPAWTGLGWWRIYDFNPGMADNASSMRNRRNYDSLLARDWPAGNSIRYCAESHSSDSVLGDNAIGNNTASSFANVADDIHC